MRYADGTLTKRALLVLITLATSATVSVDEAIDDGDVYFFAPELTSARPLLPGPVLLPFPPILPEPREWANGTQKISLCSLFRIMHPAPSSPELQHIIARYRTLIMPKIPGACAEPELLTLLLQVRQPSAALGYTTDESYSLFIPPVTGLTAEDRLRISRISSDFAAAQTQETEMQNGLVATLWAETQVGALRGLETFSQLVKVQYSNDGAPQRGYVIEHAPWLIIDSPRFQHREVLIDSARHFLPVSTIKDIVASLPLVKINVLHWHIVDDQAFPLDSASNPLLSHRGAFSDEERYTAEDIAEVVEWARLHAVRVLPEIDIPGHASSWCKGYPEVCPSDDCKTPLSPVMPTRLTPDATDATFELISRLFDDVCSMFPDALLHLGHDEVDTSCWDKTPHVTEWLLKNGNMTSQQALEHFLLRAHYMAASHGRTVVAWDEVWDVLGRHLPADTVVQQWRWGCPHCDVNVGDSVNRTRDITSAGYKVVWMVDPTWYLDNIDEPWQNLWGIDICEGLSEAQCRLVIGGGGAMWGEHVDASNIQPTIWPRLATIAEALWSPPVSARRSGRSKTWDERLAIERARLKSMRCLLNRRGVAAAPVDNQQARAPPPGPGACMAQ